jgi:HlyD family type I secretion membrane fusion protein
MIRGGLIVVAITFLGFGSWAALAPLARGAHVIGHVVTDSNRKTIQHLEGGIIKEIRVKEGSQVKAGDILIVLDETQSRANLEIVSQRNLQEVVQEARLIAERDSYPRIRWPESLRPYQDDARVKAAMADQEALFVARKNEFDGQIRAMTERIGQLRRQAEALRRQVEANKEQSSLLATDVQAQRDLEKKGFVSANRVRDYERQAAQIKAEMSAREAEVAEVEANIQATELQIIQTRQGFNRQVVTELQASRAKLHEYEEQLTASSDVKERLIIRAPVDGQVVGLDVHTVGGVIRPGNPIMDIVPDNDRLMIEAKVRLTDIDVAHAGLPAEIRFSSLPPRQSPLLKGSVISVSNDTLTDPATHEQYYLARVEVKEGEMHKLSSFKVVSGMPVEVLVSAGERTMLDYLVAPVEGLFWRAMKED